MYPAPPDSVRVYLYYAVRVKDLLQRHGRQAWRLLKGDSGMQARATRENETSALRAWLLSP